MEYISYLGVDKKRTIWYNKNMRKSERGSRADVSVLRKNGTSSKCREKSFGNTKVLLQEYPEEVRQQAIKHTMQMQAVGALER